MVRARSWFADVPGQVIGGAILTGVTALLHAIFKILPWGWPVTIVFLLAVFTLVVVAVNQTGVAWERKRKSRLSRPTPELIERTIHDWLYHHDFQIANQPRRDAYFQIAATDDQGAKIGIFQVRGRQNVVTVNTTMVIPEGPHQQRLDALTGAPYSRLLHDLRLEMVRLGVSWDGLSHPLRQITFEHTVIFDDNLTDIRFLDQIGLVRRAIAVARLLMAHALGDEEQGSQRL